MWLILSILSAFSAALVTIFAKLGLRGLDSDLATTIRSIIMAIFLICISLTLGKFKDFSFSSLSGRDWILMILAGVAGALSWLFYFGALKMGDSTKVAAIDRMSILFIIILSGMFLGEKLTGKSIFGAILIVVGALLIIGV